MAEEEDKIVCSNNKLTKLGNKANLHGNTIKILSVEEIVN